MRITVNGVPLLVGQTKAVAIAMAKMEADLAEKPATGDRYQDEPAEALLKLVREVRELLQCERRGGDV